MEIREVSSKRGKPLYFVNKYLYEIEKKKVFTLCCRCVRAREEKCRARITLIAMSELAVERVNGEEHTHGPDIGGFKGRQA